MHQMNTKHQYNTNASNEKIDINTINKLINIARQYDENERNKKINTNTIVTQNDDNDNKDIEFNANPNMDVYYEKNDKEYYSLTGNTELRFSLVTNFLTDVLFKMIPKNEICLIYGMPIIMAITIVLGLTLGLITLISVLIYWLFPIVVVAVFSDYLVHIKNNYLICDNDDISSNFQLYLFLFILYYAVKYTQKSNITLNMHRVLKKYMKVLKKHKYTIDLSLLIAMCMLLFGIAVLKNDCFQSNVSKNKYIYVTCYLCVVHNVIEIIYKIALEFTYPYPTYVIYKEILETVYVQKKQNTNDDNNENYEFLKTWIIGL